MLGGRRPANYAVLQPIRLGHPGLPLAAAAAALVPLLSCLGFALFPVVILLFPDGRMASPRWRWVLWAYAGLVAWATAATLAQTIAVLAGHHVRLDGTGDVVTRGHPASDTIQGTIVVAVLAIWLSFAAHQVLRWRRASGERRQQLKWLAGGGAVGLVSFIGATVARRHRRGRRCGRSAWWPSRSASRSGSSSTVSTRSTGSSAARSPTLSSPGCSSVCSSAWSC